MKYVWIIACFLVLVAAGSLFWFFQQPENIAWLIGAAVSALASMVLPRLAKRMSPEREAEWRKRKLRGEGDEKL